MPELNASHKVLIDNDRVRVSEWRLPPDAGTGRHRHEFDYVVVPLTDAHLRIVSADGEGAAGFTQGAPYFREAGVQHDVINAGERDLAFIEIELKERPAQRVPH